MIAGMPKPPWIQCPYNGWGYGSMAWRMSGEDIWWDWVAAWRKLTHQERLDYIEQYPAPRGWAPFYEHWLNIEEREARDRN
jgi:hypothetical protein